MERRRIHDPEWPKCKLCKQPLPRDQADALGYVYTINKRRASKIKIYEIEKMFNIKREGPGVY